VRRSIGAGDIDGTFSGGGLTGTVSASAPYALHVEYGTSKHEYGPKKKKVMRWASDGGRNGWAFSKWVKHPGTAAQPFLHPALAGNRDAIVRRFQTSVRRAIVRAKKAGG
jgi:hypothetical protein